MNLLDMLKNTKVIITMVLLNVTLLAIMGYLVHVQKVEKENKEALAKVIRGGNTKPIKYGTYKVKQPEFN